MPRRGARPRRRTERRGPSGPRRFSLRPAAAERILSGEKFKPSLNDYDWLGPGIYFWESNPRRGIDYARELARIRRRSGPKIKKPIAIGAVIRVLHDVRESEKDTPVETVRGVFVEGDTLYPGGGIYAKTHIQICVCNPANIKGVFRVADEFLM